MPYFKTAQEWLTQSALLIEARPTTTRITTKYTIPNLSKKTQSKNKSESKSRRKNKYKNSGENEEESVKEDVETITISTPAPASIPATTNSAATLTLKTYDPVSGVTLKYKTQKAAEVGRLVQIMGRLGRGMAGLAMNEEIPVVGAETLEKNISTVDVPSSSGKKSKGKKKNKK